MIVSELISRLRALQADNGDVDVIDNEKDSVADVSFSKSDHAILVIFGEPTAPRAEPVTEVTPDVDPKPDPPAPKAKK